MEQAEADHAKADQVRMAQDVADMFNEFRTLVELHAELHDDRARMETVLERARQDADRQRADHAAELERVQDELDRARQDAGLWREEADRERARSANLQADTEHTEREGDGTTPDRAGSGSKAMVAAALRELGRYTTQNGRGSTVIQP